MKIVHLSCVAPPQIGGIGRVAAKEVELLAQRGFETRLLAPQDKDFPALWRYGNTAVSQPFALRKILGEYDIVHLHYPFYGTAEIVALWKIFGSLKRLVITLHMDAKVEKSRDWILGINRALFQPWVVGSADALLASSKDYVENSSFGRWVSSPKFVELPFGVDEVRFCPGEKHLEKFGVPVGAKVVMFVGAMDRPHAFKGVDVLLRAFAQLSQDTWCVLGGDGGLRPGFEKLAQELGVADRVRFIGRVDDRDLPDVYRAGDVFAFPSTSGAEAFGLVAVEAQACGVPVVASDLPGVRTVVDDRTTGLLTPAGGADELAAHLRLILENPGMRQEMGVAARQRVLDRFTWSRHVDGLVDVYSKICASRS